MTQPFIHWVVSSLFIYRIYSVSFFRWMVSKPFTGNVNFTLSARVSCSILYALKHQQWLNMVPEKKRFFIDNRQAFRNQLFASLFTARVCSTRMHQSISKEIRPENFEIDSLPNNLHNLNECRNFPPLFTCPRFFIKLPPVIFLWHSRGRILFVRQKFFSVQKLWVLGVFIWNKRLKMFIRCIILHIIIMNLL